MCVICVKRFNDYDGCFSLVRQLSADLIFAYLPSYTHNILDCKNIFGCIFGTNFPKRIVFELGLFDLVGNAKINGYFTSILFDLRNIKNRHIKYIQCVLKSYT